MEQLIIEAKHCIDLLKEKGGMEAVMEIEEYASKVKMEIITSKTKVWTS